MSTFTNIFSNNTAALLLEQALCAALVVLHFLCYFHLSIIIFTSATVLNTSSTTDHESFLRFIPILIFRKI